MIFKKFAAFFQPHELDALTAAYDAAWQQVQARKPIKDGEAFVLKNNLAQIILASVCERDAERLKQIALRAVFSKRPNKQPEPAR